MPKYNSLCDDHYVNLNLTTEMELPSNRDTVLHYFEQLKKKYPGMENFYSRDKTDYVLEEDKTSGSYRWATVEQHRVGSVPGCKAFQCDLGAASELQVPGVDPDGCSLGKRMLLAQLGAFERSPLC